jgi:hypothetical protein
MQDVAAGGQDLLVAGTTAACPEEADSRGKALQGSQTPELSVAKGTSLGKLSWQSSVCPEIQRGAGQGQGMSLKAKSEEKHSL